MFSNTMVEALQTGGLTVPPKARGLRVPWDRKVSTLWRAWGCEAGPPAEVRAGAASVVGDEESGGRAVEATGMAGFRMNDLSFRIV
jgi:hypothetical protein